MYRGADLRKIALGDPNRLEPFGSAPMGPIRMRLTKPVIAVVRGYAVAGGLELALWADLRVCDESAKFGVFCRRVGVPLIDGGTIRLARILGRSRALDLLLTGREIDSEEALSIGLVRVLSINLGNRIEIIFHLLVYFFDRLIGEPCFPD